MDTPSTRSPGDSVFTIAASRAPVPAQVSMITSCRVPKNGFMPSLTRSRSALNSSPRWLTIWRAPASRTDGGRAVGPGIRRLGSKRVTVVLLVGEGASALCPLDVPLSTLVYMLSYEDGPDHDPPRRRPP